MPVQTSAKDWRARMEDSDWFVIRDSIHGFVRLTHLERDIINHPAFQRLKRITQLSWTNMVYPSANHTRFEHSIGVVDVADRVYSTIWAKAENLLNEYGIKSETKERSRIVVRLAALMHDMGHGPFSHSSEECFPKNQNGIAHEHSDYSISIIENILGGKIAEDKKIQEFGIEVGEITSLIKGGLPYSEKLFWKNIISSQLDADRMDYLLRDSHSTGTRYGWFDIDRVIETVNVGYHPESKHLVICTEEGGIHSVEALLLARYYMFNQVYFHPVRRGYDIFLKEVLSRILPDGHYPLPSKDEIEEYLKWDDWRVQNEIIELDDLPLRDMFLNREKPVCLLRTKSVGEFESALEVLGKCGRIYPDEASPRWYHRSKEIFIRLSEPTNLQLLSLTSPLIKALKEEDIYHIFCRSEDEPKFENALEEIE
jgi:HD superfamily phosphohydrolase